MNIRAALSVLCLFAAAIAPAQAASRFAAEGDVTAVFAPQEDPQAALVELIAQARSRIAVQAYVFTSKPLAEALIGAQRRGVTVEVLLDAKMHQRGNAAVQRLLDEGVVLYALSAFASAHDKVMLVDAAPGELCAVATGSYNFTWSAQHRNAENLLIVRHHCELAARYAENWQAKAREAVRIGRFPLAK
ncbi:MAG: DUF1669 domain-containing protein [Rhodocyclaceae bacterium]|nr:DUF1669 domain-containing protein [Rhodocyclaceae bacterium]